MKWLLLLPFLLSATWVKQSDVPRLNSLQAGVVVYNSHLNCTRVSPEPCQDLTGMDPETHSLVEVDVDDESKAPALVPAKSEVCRVPIDCAKKDKDPNYCGQKQRKIVTPNEATCFDLSYPKKKALTPRLNPALKDAKDAREALRAQKEAEKKQAIESITQKVKDKSATKEEMEAALILLLGL